MKRNRDFTKLFKKEHVNKWVALNPAQDFIVDSGSSPKRALREAQKKGTINPILTFVVKDYGNLV